MKKRRKNLLSKEEKDTIRMGLITCMFVIIFLVLAMLVGCTSCQPAVRSPKENWQITKLERKCAIQERMLREYNHLLHQVWIDKPNYVEDVLTECDAFCALDSMMDGHWGDTFSFYNKMDSITYNQNWSYGDSASDLPEHIRMRLHKIWPDEY